MTDVLAPQAGTVVALSQVPDPVFAGEMVGPGVAIDPERAPATVVAPIAGTIVKLHPHAFVISGDGAGVLVHLGIDTVQLHGEGFTLVAAEGDTVAAGDPVVSWDPAAVESGGKSPIIPVILMDAPAGSVTSPVQDEAVAAGDAIFALP